MNTNGGSAGPCWRTQEARRAPPLGDAGGRALGHAAADLSLRFQPSDFQDQLRAMKLYSRIWYFHFIAIHSQPLTRQKQPKNSIQGISCPTPFWQLQPQLWEAQTASSTSISAQWMQQFCVILAVQLIILLQHSDWHFLFTFFHHLPAVGCCCCSILDLLILPRNELEFSACPWQ